MKAALARLWSVRTLLQIASAASLLVFAFYVARWMTRPTYGFGMYYTYSRLLLEGGVFSRVYDFDYFNTRMHEFGIATIDMPNNLPTAALPMLPIAWLPPHLAKAAWTAISVVLLLWSLRILFRLFAVNPMGNFGLVIITLVFVYRPLYDGIALGQMYLLILWLLCLGLSGLSEQKATLVSSSLALSMLLKGYGVVQLLWLSFKSNLRAVLGTIILALFAVLVLLPVFGVNSWTTFYRMFAVRSVSPENSQVLFQTVNSFFLHFLSFDAHWTPFPILALPQWIVLGLADGMDIVLIILVIRWSGLMGKADMPLAYSASFGVGVLTFPLASEYHFVLFLPLIIGLTTRLYRGVVQSRTLRPVVIIVGLSVLVMAAPLKYQQLQQSDLPLSLLAYPKLYAGIALILCFRHVARQGAV